MTTEGTVEAFRRAEELLAQRRPLEALRVLEPVVDVAQDKPSVQLLLGRAYFFTAQLNRAERAFRRVLEFDPSDHYARLVLGRTLQRQGRLTEARAQIRLAATMNPDPAYQEALGEINAHIAIRSS
ncbi:tetratricopeptide repeat protein [Saccharopolyspora rhizosphaerae]|uniref:Tetratricopeptide repeat protein n=1 Tax=Saccharopolyspora rhizosphaerae TaxID=2492662 RepID=A0A426JQS1_9PSEU|nr:tetratricopeptide repeat protein [Saccharopolyspora rhizosphaerae]RRO15492.1 tetratricopeptide repeat protein [Saccharopolyspora rhizosphaerae]